MVWTFQFNSVNSCEGRLQRECGLCQLFLAMLPASAVFSHVVCISSVCFLLWDSSSYVVVDISLTVCWPRACLLSTAR